jgi:hypothetical protein
MPEGEPQHSGLIAQCCTVAYKWDEFARASVSAVTAVTIIDLIKIVDLKL